MVKAEPPAPLAPGPGGWSSQHCPRAVAVPLSSLFQGGKNWWSLLDWGCWVHPARNWTGIHLLSQSCLEEVAERCSGTERLWNQGWDSPKIGDKFRQAQVQVWVSLGWSLLVFPLLTGTPNVLHFCFKIIYWWSSNLFSPLAFPNMKVFSLNLSCMTWNCVHYISFLWLKSSRIAVLYLHQQIAQAISPSKSTSVSLCWGPLCSKLLDNENRKELLLALAWSWAAKTPLRAGLTLQMFVYRERKCSKWKH